MSKELLPPILSQREDTAGVVVTELDHPERLCFSTHWRIWPQQDRTEAQYRYQTLKAVKDTAQFHGYQGA